MRTRFSLAYQFRRGQYVTASGRNGIAVGWTRGLTSKAIVVKMTEGPNKGKRMAFRVCDVTDRRGNKGRGLLPRLV